MTTYWKKFKKFFEKSKAKKAALVACKSFDKTKETLEKEYEEKNSDLKVKVVEVYRSSSTYISKKLLKEADEASVKDNGDAVCALLQELANAGFPGAQGAYDAGSKFGTTLAASPVLYVLQKASVHVAEEELPPPPEPELPREAPAEEAAKVDAPAASEESHVAPAPEATSEAVTVVAESREVGVVREPAVKEAEATTTATATETTKTTATSTAVEPPAPVTTEVKAVKTEEAAPAAKETEAAELKKEEKKEEKIAAEATSVAQTVVTQIIAAGSAAEAAPAPSTPSPAAPAPSS